MICDRSVNYVSKGKGVPRKDNDNTFITHTTLSFMSSICPFNGVKTEYTSHPQLLGLTETL
jgi:hypothetical protein